MGEQWRPKEPTELAAAVPPPPSRDTLAGTRALVRTIPTRLTLHPTLKNRLVPHPLVQYEESEAWPGSS